MNVWNATCIIAMRWKMFSTLFFLFPSHPYLKVSHFYFCFHTSHVASRIEYLKVTGTTGTSSNEHAFNRSHPRTTHHAFAPTRTILCLRFFFFGNKSYLKSIWTRSDNASFSVDACQWGVNKVVILFITCWWIGDVCKLCNWVEKIKMFQVNLLGENRLGTGKICCIK